MSTFGGGALWGGGSSGTAGASSGTPATDLFYMSMRLCGMNKAAQVGASPDQLLDCVQAAQLMLDQASVRRPVIFGQRITTYALGTNKIYTLGPQGTLLDGNGKSNRPVHIEKARLILSTGTPIHLKIYQGSYSDFANLAVQDIPGALPTFLYCDYNVPNANVYLIPQDRGGDTLELYDWQPLASIQNATDRIVLPPGYTDWFVQNLAVRLASVFKEQGASVSEETKSDAILSTRAVQRLNMQSPKLRSDAPGANRGSGTFNYYSGQ